MKGLSGLFSCVEEKNPHLTSSESHAKPLPFLASRDGPGYAHTVTDFLLFRSLGWARRTEVGEAGHAGLNLCSASSWDLCFQPVGLTSHTPDNLSSPALHFRSVYSSSPPSSWGCGAKSENCFAAQLRRDCCCCRHGDSQTAQSPLLLSGVPPTWEVSGPWNSLVSGGLSTSWHLAWRIVGLFAGSR